MRKADHSSVTDRRALRILIGYNLPWLLWTVWALFAFCFESSVWRCQVKALLGWCPGCGLTRSYAQLIAGRVPDHPLLPIVLLGFVFNFAYSVYKARSLSEQDRPTS